MITVGKTLEELGITEWALFGEPTNETEFLEMFKKISGEDADGTATYEEDSSAWGVTWTQVSTKKAELEAGEPLRLLREERNKRIAETDWWASSDLTMTSEQTAYRQALRDITETYSNLDDVVWPTKP